MYTISYMVGTLCVIFCALSAAVRADGFLQIQFDKYENHDGRVKDGTLCDPFGAIDVGDKCDPVFRLRADVHTRGGNGLYDYQQMSHYDNIEIINFGGKFGDIANPVTMAMNFKNPGRLFLTIDVVDKDTFPPDDPMDTFQAEVQLIADNKKRVLVVISLPLHHRLYFTYWYTCNANYFGLDCNTYCVAHNDNTNGHYTCDSSGQKVCMTGWVGAACTTPDPCLPSPCLNAGTCSNNAGVAACACPPNFAGSRCEADVNECLALPSPCLNNATCENTVGAFRCRCPLGFTGSRCESDVDECSVSESPVCLNSGTCVNTIGGFNCTCPKGLTGGRCELDVDECAKGTSGCANGAKCLNTFGNYTCECSSGFQGRFCEEDIDECLETPCSNGGTCNNTIGSFTCECPAGLTGSLCDVDVNECLKNPCSNGGTCVNAFGNFSCECPAGWTGELCEEDINECLETPCSNGSTCVNTNGNFSCECPVGYTGRLCDQDIDECNLASSKCQNGGNCTNTMGSYNCVCPAGLTGRHCEVDIDEFSLPVSPCQNGGRCNNSFGGFFCNCYGNFSGSRCEIRFQASINQFTDKSWKLIVALTVGIGGFLIALGVAIFFACKYLMGRRDHGEIEHPNAFDNNVYSENGHAAAENAYAANGAADQNKKSEIEYDYASIN